MAVPSRPSSEEYTKSNLDLLGKSLDNLRYRLTIIQKSGIKPGFCLSFLATDSKEEIALVRQAVEKAGARFY